MQHQMEVLNPIYMAPDMTVLTKMVKRQTFDGFDRMFPFKKRDISEWDSGYEPKIINWGS